MQKYGLDVRRLELARPARHLDVAEAVAREGGLVGLDAAPAEDVHVGGLGQAQGPGPELAVLEDLGVAQSHLGPGRSVHPEAGDAGDDLTEVDEHRTGRGAGDGHRREDLDAADRRPDRGLQLLGDALQLDDRRPRRVVERRGGPRRVLEPGVVVLAVVEAGGQCGPRPARQDASVTTMSRDPSS